MRGFTRAWLAWAVASGLGFAVIEAKALRGADASATLSAHTRHVFGFDDQGPLPQVRRGVFYAFWGWFGLHILKRTTGCVSCITPPMPPS